MKHELDRIMSIIKDYKTGYGGVTDSFMRKELEMFAKDYHSEQLRIHDVVGRSEQLPQIHGLIKCECGKVYDVDIENVCPSCGNCLQR